MDPLTLQFPAVAPSPALATSETERLRTRVSALLARTQTNPYLFASPMGPFTFERRAVWLPRFVFCGPHASDESWRVALFAGTNHRDLRATHALLRLAESLARDAAHAHGLNLTFFPLIDAAGLALEIDGRSLDEESWRDSSAPELQLLTRDIQTRGYHGFVRVETSRGEELPTLSLRARADLDSSTPDVELLSSRDFEGIDLRFERLQVGGSPVSGPLSLADDLGIQPFELTLRLPSALTRDAHERLALEILTRFLHRYRAFQAYGGDL
jgi:hypothetical protein